MFPKNVIFFRFSVPLREDIEEALKEHTVRDPGTMELAAAGFSSPYGRTDDRMLVRHGKVLGFVYEVRERDLTPRAVNAEVQRRVDKIVDEEDRQVRTRERVRLRDDVLQELLPKAVILARMTRGWIDLDNCRVVVDARTRKRAEEVLSGLRGALGSLPALPPAPYEDPRTLMTAWLAEATPPKGVALGDECELRDPCGSNGSLVRCRRQDLDTDEIREHLRSGKQCFSTGLFFDDRLGFVLADDLSIKALRPTDLVLDDGADSHESMAQEVEGNFALAVLELNRLLAFIEQEFRVAIALPEAA